MKLRVVVAEAWRSLTASLSTTVASAIETPGGASSSRIVPSPSPSAIIA